MLVETLIGGMGALAVLLFVYGSAIADRKLPEIIALIERSQLVRSWLECAARCECPDLDQCPLFDDPALPPRRDSAPARRRRSQSQNGPYHAMRPRGQ